MLVFQVKNDLKVVLFLGLFLYCFLVISDSIFRRSGLPNRGFRIEVIAKIDFSWKSFSKNFWIVLLCFADALGTVFLTF